MAGRAGAESGTRSASPLLEAAHAQLHRTDHVGDFAEGTMRCSDSSDEWQVGTRLFEGPKRYYRVRWRPPFSFTLVGVSETPSAACTAKDEHADVHPDILSDLR